MGRRNTIDREHVLKAAEALVSEQGSGALTIAAVAEAAGITKGGVQSCFGSKEALIAAMLQRWLTEYELQFAQSLADRTDAISRVAAHVAVTRDDDAGSQARAAGLLAMLIQHPEHLRDSRDWYTRRIADLDLAKPAERRAMAAFLAAEGAFFLRFLGLLPMDDQLWRSMFEEIAALASPEFNSDNPPTNLPASR